MGYRFRSSLYIAIVKGVAALWTELGRFCGVGRLPAAFVALILRHTGGFGLAEL